HAELASQRLRAAQLLVRQPLQVRIEFNFLRMSSGELRRRLSVHVPELLRPAQPAGCRSRSGAKIAVERIEAGMRAQKIAARGHESEEIVRAAGPGAQMPV